MILELNPNSSVPLYQQIQSLVIEGIATGLLQPGQQLPSVRQLSADLGVNLHTVNKAYQFLRDEGYISLSSRSGAVIDLSNLDRNRFEMRLKTQSREILAEAISHGLSEDEIHSRVQEQYQSLTTERNAE